MGMAALYASHATYLFILFILLVGQDLVGQS
jgi:hypothetical protein